MTFNDVTGAALCEGALDGVDNSPSKKSVCTSIGVFSTTQTTRNASSHKPRSSDIQNKVECDENGFCAELTTCLVQCLKRRLRSISRRRNMRRRRRRRNSTSSNRRRRRHRSNSRKQFRSCRQCRLLCQASCWACRPASRLRSMLPRRRFSQCLAAWLNVRS